MGAWLGDAHEGLVYARHDPFVARLVPIQALTSLAVGATSALLVVLASRHLHSGAEGFGWLLEPVMDFSYKHRTNGGSSDAIMRETDGERVFLGRRTGHGASVWLLSAPGDRHVSLASDE